MSDETLFGGGETTPPATTEQTPAPTISIPDNVKDMIGEGKKYATVEKALEALGHSQEFIAQLKEETATLRTRVEQAVTNDQVYQTVQDLLKQDRSTNGVATLDEAAVATILERQLTAREQKAIADSNTQSVRDALVSAFHTPEKAEEVFQTRAKELGMTTAALKAMAATTPKAALELLGVKPAAKPAPAHSRGTVNTEALATVPGQPQKPKSVMGGATTNEIMDAWRKAKPNQ